MAANGKFVGLGLTALRSNFSQLSRPYKLTFSMTYLCQSRCLTCVRPEEIILGDNEKISTLQVGAHSIGVSGLNDISRTFSRTYKGNLLRIKASGLLPLEVTPEHPILTSRSETTRHHERKQRNHYRNYRTLKFSAPDWMNANNLKAKNSFIDGDYLCTPVVERSCDTKELGLEEFTKPRGAAISKGKGHSLIFPLNDETAWLLGVYTAEGCPASNGVRLSFNTKETHLHDKVKSVSKRLGYSVTKTEDGRGNKCMTCCISSPILARAFADWCGHGATNKKIPDFILLHKDDSILRSFLQGWEEGDAYLKDGLVTGSTVSKTLVLQLQLAYASLGIDSKVSYVHKEEALFYGKPIRLHDVYVIKYYKDEKRNNRYVHRSGRYFLHPIRSIKSVPYDGKVCNIETSDNSYLVSNATVHNCNIWEIKPKNELTLDEIKEFARKNNSFRWIELTGGEPFLRGDIVEIVRTFKENCKDLYLLTMPTNSLCNSDMVVRKLDEILSLGVPKVVITLSLDGYRELHDKIRGIQGNYDKVMDMARRLRELQKRHTNLYFVFGFTMSKFNQGLLGQTVNEVQKELPGIRYNDFHINVGQVSDIYYTNQNLDIRAERSKLAEEIAGFLAKRDFELTPLQIVENAFLKKLVNYVKDDKPPMRSRSLDVSLFLDSYGNVYPSVMWGRKVGNIRESSYDLSPIWGGADAEEVRRLIREGKEPNAWTACEAYQTLVGNVLSLI